MSWRAHIALRLGRFDLDITLEGGDAPLVLIGPNGSGKSSTLRAIAGAYALRAEHLSVDGELIADSASGLSCPPEGRRVGYVPQGFALFPHLSVIDNVAFGASTPGSVRRERALELLTRLGAGSLAERGTQTLSSGEAQRVALARALMIRPRLLLLDEPLSALDLPSRRLMREFLAHHLASEGTPSLMVTHDVRDVRALNATVVVLEGGRVLQVGSAAELKARPENAFVEEFFDGLAS